jgi:hypothetical protein
VVDEVTDKVNYYDTVVILNILILFYDAENIYCRQPVNIVIQNSDNVN